MALTLTPGQKKLAWGIAIAVGLFLLYWFVIRKYIGKKDDKPADDKAKAKADAISKIKAELEKCQKEYANAKIAGVHPCTVISERLKKAEESSFGGGSINPPPPPKTYQTGKR